METFDAPSTRHRYDVLDSYRFIAALGIVAYHFEGHFAVFFSHPRDFLEDFQTLVDFFFVLSGFVLMHTYGSRIKGWTTYAAFLRKRAARVYPLHVATLLICVVLYIGVATFGIAVRDPSIIDMHLLLPNLLLVQAWGFTDHAGLNSPSWSISAEAFVYLLFPLFVVIARRLRPAMTLCLAVLSIVLIEVTRRAYGLPTGSVATFDFGMMRAVPMFLAGIATYGIVIGYPPRSFPWLVPHALSCLIVAMMLLKCPAYAIDLLYPPLVALIALAERGGRPTWLASPVMTQLANASFAIYMIHTFVQIACVGLVRRLGWITVQDLIIVAVVGSAIIIFVGLTSFWLLESPMRRWLSGSARLSEGALPPERSNLEPARLQTSRARN